MNPRFSDSSAYVDWMMRNEAGEAAAETRFVPLDDFLQVEVLASQNLRRVVKAFLIDHCRRSSGISFIAARGKLTASLVALARHRSSFGDVVKAVRTALDGSILPSFAGLDARELARVLCIPAVDV